jgi:uncharacterized protein (TIGR03437 family)
MNVITAPEARSGDRNMRHFTIENETNNITVHTSAKEADAVPDSERFSNEAALAKLAANWAVAGEALSMYTTGLVEGGVMPPEVSVGGLVAKVLYFGDAPGYPGYFQVNFQVPIGVTAGSAVPVHLMYFGRSSNTTTIAVQ